MNSSDYNDRYFVPVESAKKGEVAEKHPLMREK